MRAVYSHSISSINFLTSFSQNLPLLLTLLCNPLYLHCTLSPSFYHSVQIISPIHTEPRFSYTINHHLLHTHPHSLNITGSISFYYLPFESSSIFSLVMVFSQTLTLDSLRAHSPTPFFLFMYTPTYIYTTRMIWDASFWTSHHLHIYISNSLSFSITKPVIFHLCL